VSASAAPAPRVPKNSRRLTMPHIDEIQRL
jgi:hypothetical protein